MGRVYSRGACLTCKRRRKKCGEQRPSCDTCVRLQLDCSYGGGGKQQQQQVEEAAAAVSRPQEEPVSPTGLVRRLRIADFSSSAEEGVFCRVHQAATSFYTPATSAQTRDLSELWQMTLNDDLMRNAVVACFSSVLGHTPQYGHLNRRAYGSALQLIRSRITEGELDKTDGIVLRASVNFLGLLDCVGPDWSDDLTRHWKGLAKLLIHFRSDISRDPFPLNMQILESFTYNTSCLALFTDDVHALCLLWQQTRVISILEETNPEGPDRISNSPLLSGEYGMYDSVLSITCLHRRAAYEQIDATEIDELESTVRHQGFQFNRRFTRASFAEVTLQQQQAMREMYRGLATCLWICLIALREPSTRGGEEIDALVSQSLGRLSVFLDIPICLAALMWPLQILACAIRRDEDFDELEVFVGRLKVYLDPGHKRRLLAVMATVRNLRKESREEDERTPSHVPVGLSLLRKPKGILS